LALREADMSIESPGSVELHLDPSRLKPWFSRDAGTERTEVTTEMGASAALYSFLEANGFERSKVRAYISRVSVAGDSIVVQHSGSGEELLRICELLDQKLTPPSVEPLPVLTCRSLVYLALGAAAALALMFIVFYLAFLFVVLWST
jgi:hypothetical protein